MTRTTRIIRNIAIGIGALLLLVIVSVLAVVHTDWFRNYVREKIITATEDGTGGRVEIGSFNFDVSDLRAVVTNFVIHGTEPSGAAPFVQAARVEVDIRLFTSIHHLLDITFLGVQKPQVNVIVSADGRTNIPTPKTKSTSNKSALETVVDLAVGHFELTNGLATFNSKKQPLDVRANNLHAQLFYSVAGQSYQGKLTMEPLYVLSGRNTPVNFKVDIPVALHRDRIDIRNATISTPVSTISINGSMENMNSPKVSAHINGRVATIDLENAANLPLAVNAKNVPGELDLEANATASSDAIDVAGLRITLGKSNFEASGRLKDPGGNASLQFRSELAPGELGRLAKFTAPDTPVTLSGVAKLDAANNLDLTGLHVTAIGAEFDGSISLADFQRYKVQGNLRNLDIRNAARLFHQKIPYDGVISGSVDAQGEKAVVAAAHFTVSPGRQGIPVSGRINADYNSATDNIVVERSYVALPHSRLTLDGSVGKQLNIALTTRDLRDLMAPPTVTFEKNGEASFTGAVTGGLSAPRVTGHLAANQFSVEGRQFNTLGADIAAAPNSASIRNGTMTRGSMRASFNANVGLHNWSAPPRAPLTANASISNGDLADVMALAGQPTAGYSGALSANAQVGGTIGNPQGSATIQILNGKAADEPFNQIQAQVNLANQLVTIPAAYAATPAGRVNLTAEFRHPRDSFSTGSVHAHLQSDPLNLTQLHTVQQREPNAGGTVQINADVNGTLEPKEFLLTGVNADASARNLQLEGQNYGDLNATARTSGQTVSYNVTSNFAGSNLHVTGNTQLTHDYPTTADAAIGNLPIERMLTLAKQSGVPARGNLSGTAHFSGTMANPQGNVDIELTRAVIYNEPLDRIRARVTYLAKSIDVPEFEIAAGPSRIDLAAHYDHPAGNFQQGAMRFNVTSSHIDLSRIRNLQSLRPGLGGTLDLSASGAGTIRESEPRVLFSALNANVAANGITAQGHNYGDLKLTANTAGNNRLHFAVDSNLADAAIHGRGDATLAGDYPVNAQLTLNNVTWTHIQNLLGRTNGEPPSFEALTDIQVSVNGPVLKTDQLNGSLQVSRLNLTTIPRPGMGKPVTIANQGPIMVALDHGNVRIQSAHLTGPQTDIQATGTASLATRALNANVNANADLSVLQNFDRDLYASGKIALATVIRGTMSQPLVNGQLALQNASVNYASVPNGISNANGTVVFNGNSARIQNLTAESGGGKLNVTGFVGFATVLRFGVRAGASNVRVRAQQGVSITADANIRLTGTMQNSLISGDVTIDQVNYAPQSDIGSMLTRAAPPVQSPTTPSPLLDNMKLDIRVRTAPGMAVQASLAENLQADADLRVRGTASQPGVLGRVTINEGQLVFFGAQYTVDTGTISFYNPIAIQPILDISLQTQAKGVTVTVRVTGPIDNMNLSYTSDPPLQFQEIVSLLATGKTPTSDPTILANQPTEPAQGFQQMGESAILGQAVANPVASRLQRVFGLTQFKIDPSFTSGSDVPTARLTLQQRITNNITFTYVSAIDDPNSTIIRVEWAFNPQWSAVATRDQNGIFSINFFYKRQFR